MKPVLLVGNPNCGKTTLFNALTGANQRVGNWPGVTVEKKTGQFQLTNQVIQITDLPGVYSLATSTDASSLDEQIAAQAILAMDAELIINVVDACHLERHLYLTSQVLELGKPVVVVLNMMDIAAARGIAIDVAALALQLNCPVIPLQAHKRVGFAALFGFLEKSQSAARPLPLQLPPALKTSLALIQAEWVAKGKSAQALYYASRQMEREADFDLPMADARYQLIHEIVLKVQKKTSDASEHFTAKLDRIVLNRYLAFPLFFAMMYLMFLFAINVGGAFQDFFDMSSEALFVRESAALLQQIHAPQWLIALIANGVGKGINTTLTFIPVIGSMFFFLSLLEASGYMARAAFVVDKAMRMLGLPGKSFVPMIVGFGCNVPAIMAARTLDSERDRTLTVLMSPFMSCSARLAIYAVFVAAFFPTGGQNIVFSLYLIGIGMAVLTGLLLRKTALAGKPSPLILELPAYHKPSIKRLLRETLMRLRYFVIRAGRLIIPVCVLLGGLNALTIDGGLSRGEASAQSVLSLIGQGITPLFAPMGLSESNWPATVGLLTGMLAKEVVIGTLNSLYAQMGHLTLLPSASFDLLTALKDAFWTIPDNFAQLGHALTNPVMASAPRSEVSKSVYGVMVSQFDGKAGAYAYLLFVLLYIPCVSTMAAIRQETSAKLMWFSILWSLVIAYTCAVFFYQLATIARHPEQSIFWLALIIMGLVFCFNKMKHRGAYAVANS
ncbi:MAG: ferrous iron transport protein B [Tatlockia sp.]|jgi:ferrous iron transport protein B